MLDYPQAKTMMIDYLLREAENHDKGLYEFIGLGFEEIDGLLPRGGGEKFDKLFIALQFLDGWLDARNHDWKYYQGIDVSDWPVLARQIVADIEADREISDGRVIKHFGINKPTSIKEKLRSLFNR